MAWGDLRFDHSDIFSEGTSQLSRVKKGGRKVFGPDHPHWDKILRRCRTGATAIEIASALGHSNPRGKLGAFLRKMVSDGVLWRQQEDTGLRGTKPFVYYSKEK